MRSGNETTLMIINLLILFLLPILWSLIFDTLLLLFIFFVHAKS